MNFVVKVLSIGFLFFGGTLFGVVVSSVLTDSIWGSAIGLCMLPVAFLVSLAVWRIIAMASGAVSMAKDVAKGQAVGDVLAKEGSAPKPRGRFVLVMLPAGVCFISGLLIALIASQSALFIVFGYSFTGLVYGFLLLLLAGRGAFDDLLWEN